MIISFVLSYCIMKKKNRWRHIWIWFIVAFYIYFIFHHSMMVAEASNELSYGVTYKLMNFLQRFGIYTDFYVFHHYVRKLAHFAEFAGLGFLVGLAMQICPLFKSRFLNFALFLFLIPISDEFIQQFYDGRSTELGDILIDGAGILFGGFIIYIIILIIKDLFFHKNTESN